jgi:hypothetical protein
MIRDAPGAAVCRCDVAANRFAAMTLTNSLLIDDEPVDVSSVATHNVTLPSGHRATALALSSDEQSLAVLTDHPKQRDSLLLYDVCCFI